MAGVGLFGWKGLNKASGAAVAVGTIREIQVAKIERGRAAMRGVIGIARQEGSCDGRLTTENSGTGVRKAIDGEEVNQ